MIRKDKGRGGGRRQCLVRVESQVIVTCVGDVWMWLLMTRSAQDGCGGGVC